MAESGAIGGFPVRAVPPGTPCDPVGRATYDVSRFIRYASRKTTSRDSARATQGGLMGIETIAIVLGGIIVIAIIAFAARKKAGGPGTKP